MTPGKAVPLRGGDALVMRPKHGSPKVPAFMHLTPLGLGDLRIIDRDRFTCPTP
jgi:hypothetical protein